MELKFGIIFKENTEYESIQHVPFRILQDTHCEFSPYVNTH